MWRVTTLVNRQSALDEAQFSRRWQDELVPAIRDALQNLGTLRKLILDVPPTALSEKVRAVFPPQFDGMAEFWFDTAEDAAAAMKALSQDTALRSLAASIVSAADGVAWLAKVVPSKPDSGSVVKFLAAGDIVDTLTLEEAQSYWANVHPVVAQTVPETWNMLTRYTQFHGRPTPTLEMGDWLAQYRFVPMAADMGFADAEDFIAMYTHEDYLAVIRPDEEKFSRPGEMLSFVTGEERVLVG